MILKWTSSNRSYLAVICQETNTATGSLAYTRVLPSSMIDTFGGLHSFRATERSYSIWQLSHAQAQGNACRPPITTTVGKNLQPTLAKQLTRSTASYFSIGRASVWVYGDKLGLNFVKVHHCKFIFSNHVLPIWP